MTPEIKRKAANRRGTIAEARAGRFLAAHGYEILKSRYRNAHGEIDLIARHRDHIAFIEVKARRTHADAAYAVQPRQQRRIRDAADCFLAEHQSYAAFTASFDVILISPAEDLLHIPHAFLAD
jgi:putative endonuclease